MGYGTANLTFKLFLMLILWCFAFFLIIAKYKTAVTTKNLNWYFSKGVDYIDYTTTTKEVFKLFHDEGDRIVEQLMYVPFSYSKLNVKKKKILSYLGLTERDPANLFNRCPVGSCVLTDNQMEANNSDAIIFMNNFIYPTHLRFHEQVWILYLLESPFNSIGMEELSGVFNWTATYRRDSDIVTPYEKWVYYDDQVQEKHQTIDYTHNKTKKVAWLVSNCHTRNHRLQYGKDLGNYISVDIYGGCGPLRCSNCFELLKQYKFYLAFENSNCHDYITEKFFVNALGNNLIPIVMGPNKDDYLQVAPKNSFIHVNDFKNPKELADYLNFLDTHDAVYNSYFKWKGTGEFINTYFWCRLCALLHAPIPNQSHKDIDKWWSGHGICFD